MGTGKLVVGVTGASGAIYAQRFLANAADLYKDIYLILSRNAIDVAKTELGVNLDRTNFARRKKLLYASSKRVFFA